MLAAGEIQVWRVRLDRLDESWLPAASPEEEARAARFHAAPDGLRYLLSHRALRAALGRLAGGPLEFAAMERGKPYLPGFPELKFSLSHSGEMALIAAAPGVEVGADIERVRAVPDCESIAERFFPPSEAAAFAAAGRDREREFFRRWTRIEAMLKARGVGLYGAGREIEGEWTVGEIAVPGEGDYCAAVAAVSPGMRIVVEDL